MTKHLSIVMASIALAASVHAQDSSNGVTTSTEPAKAAAVEQSARDLKACSAQDTNPGKPGSSAAVVQGKTEGGLPLMQALAQRRSAIADALGQIHDQQVLLSQTVRFAPEP